MKVPVSWFRKALVDPTTKTTAALLESPMGSAFIGRCRAIRHRVLGLCGHPLIRRVIVPFRQWRETANTLYQQPGFVAFRERWAEKFNELHEAPDHPAVRRLKQSLHPPYLALAVGAILVSALGVLGLEQLTKANDAHSRQLSREAGKLIERIRLDSTAKSLDRWQSEQQDYEQALEILKSTRQQGSFILRDRLHAMTS